MKPIGTKIGMTIGLLMTTLGLQTATASLLSQIDTFDADTMSWTSGANPVHIATGGPMGSGDGFLQLSRTSYSFHIATANKAQWAGNYLAAGITALEMDLTDISRSAALNVRLMLWGDGGVWASSGLVPVAAGWNHYFFGITAADLVFVNDDVNSPPGSGGGTGILADTLRNVTIMHLRHDYPTPTIPGRHPPHITATLGIDNVAAIPEPSSLLLIMVASGSLALRRMRQNRISKTKDISASNRFNSIFSECWSHKPEA